MVTPNPAAQDPDWLKRYLADRDVPCPSCGYNLRGLTTDQCPECTQPITLSIGPADQSARLVWPLRLTLFLGIITSVWAVAAILSWLPSRLLDAVGKWWSGPGRFDFYGYRYLLTLLCFAVTLVLLTRESYRWFRAKNTKHLARSRSRCVRIVLWLVVLHLCHGLWRFLYEA